MKGSRNNKKHCDLNFFCDCNFNTIENNNNNKNEYKTDNTYKYKKLMMLSNDIIIVKLQLYY